MKIVMARVGPRDNILQTEDVWTEIRPMKGDRFFFHCNGELIDTEVVEIYFHPQRGGTSFVSPDTQILAYCR